MAEYANREHYIPLRKSDLVTLLCGDPELSAEQRTGFRKFCTLTSAIFHFEYQAWLDELKDAYAPFDPDSETQPLAPARPEDRAAGLETVFADFVRLMERANFKRLSPEEVRQAVAAHAAARGLHTDVDLTAFEHLEIFVRGEGTGTHVTQPWWRFWGPHEEPVPLFHRVVLSVKLRPHRHVPKDIRTDAVFLKVFKDIPKQSLGMFQPGARVRLSKLDLALIVYPLVFGVGLILFNIARSVWAKGTSELAAILSWSAACAVGGYGYKSYHSYLFKKQDYSLRLTRSLYFQTLDSNAGVLMRVLDEAEEQECRETFLAWFCLWKEAPPDGLAAEALDDVVERYLESRANLKVDFEIGDALAKLERLRLVETAAGRFRAVPLERALEALDYQWDNYFTYNNRDPRAEPVA